jgi:hypothetical protein
MVPPWGVRGRRQPKLRSQTLTSSSGTQLSHGVLRKGPLFFVEICGEADAALLRRRRIHQLADRGEDCGDRLIVGRELFLKTRLELIEFFSETSVRGQQLAHTDKGPHDLDVHGDGAMALEHRGEHSHALLGERVGQELAVLPATAL